VKQKRYENTEVRGELGYGLAGYFVKATLFEIDKAKETGKLVYHSDEITYSLHSKNTGLTKSFTRKEEDYCYLTGGEIVVRPSTSLEVVKYANYFGDRLPAEFYEKFAPMLREVEDVIA
jgi:hypothetical protein